MIEHEIADFTAMLGDTLELYGRKLTEGAARMWWRLLQPYDFADVMAAFERYATDPEQGKFPPTPAAVIGFMPVDPTTAQLTADEAWAIALQTFDEYASVCVNDQIMDACALARPIYLEGDKVGARMAFKSAYERVTASTRGMTTRWWLSLGHDAAGRATAAENALQRGLLPRSQVAHLLPLKPEETDHETLALIKGAIAGTRQLPAPSKAKALVRSGQSEYDRQLAEIRERARRNGVQTWIPTEPEAPAVVSNPQVANAGLAQLRALSDAIAEADRARKRAERELELAVAENEFTRYSQDFAIAS